MDITKEYIIKCKRAEVIQKLWKPKVGDYIYSIDYEKVFIIIDNLNDKFLCILPYRTDREFFPKRERSVWLPTQDRLQELVAPRDGGQHTIMENFWSWCNEVYPLNIYLSNFAIFKTMEQLWLAFVMYKKFNKVWDGEKWIESRKKGYIDEREYYKEMGIEIGSEEYFKRQYIAEPIKEEDIKRKDKMKIEWWWNKKKRKRGGE